MLLDVTRKEVEDHLNFKKKINNTPLDEIRLDGKFISPEVISEWRFTGLSNMDLLSDLDDVVEFRSIFKDAVLAKFREEG
jgi:hypothetical protein